MGSVQHLGKFIPNLSQFSHPLRPLQKKNSKFIWTAEHEKHFHLTNEKNCRATEKKNILTPNLKTRNKCDASRKVLGSAFEQRTPDGWHTVAFAWCFIK